MSALDPNDGKLWDLVISEKRAIRAASRSKGALLELRHSVAQVLREPTAIFIGVRDLENDISEDDWLCYCGIPRGTFHRDGSPRDSYCGETLLVYVNQDRRIYHWFWTEAAPSSNGLPSDHESRFRKHLL